MNLTVYETDTYNHYYIAANGKAVLDNTVGAGHPAQSGYLDSKAYQVFIQIKDHGAEGTKLGTDALANFHQAIGNKTFSVSFTATTGDNLATVWTDTSAIADNAAPGTNTALSYSNSDLKAWDGVKVSIGYVAFYANGGAAVTDGAGSKVHSSAPSCGFTATGSLA